MPRRFYDSTAEQVVQIVDAVHTKGKADQAFLERFCDLPAELAAKAIGLAEDLELIKESSGDWIPAGILAGFFSSPLDSQKAAALRLVLEHYRPFLVFRERLNATTSADQAAQETKTLLDLDAHRGDIKDTLINLGTYTRAISTEGGGRYKSSVEPLVDRLQELGAACENQLAAEERIRIQVGHHERQVDRIEVIVPLSQALLKALQNRPSDSVKDAAIAFESFLSRLAGRMGVSLDGATGICTKMEKFRVGDKLPKKIVEAGKYLAQIRNAADHGVDVDPDVNAVWHIQDHSGLLYVYVVCQMIAACLEREAGGEFIF